MTSRLVLTVMGGGLLLGACTSGGGGVERPSGAKATYIKAADPICAEIHAAVGQLGDDPVKDRDAIGAGVDKLKAITAPGDDIEKAQLFIVRLQNTALALEDVNQSGLLKDGPRTERALERAQEQDDLATE
ncbi:MAG: hypothetical protein ACRDRT_13660, partial [Pseudonocardiaceae bacterium]